MKTSPLKKLLILHKCGPTVCEKWMCCSEYVSRVSLCKNVSSTKRTGRKKNNSIHLCPFSLWPPDRPTDGLTDHRLPLRPERIFRAQCFRVTCFTSEKDFWTRKKNEIRKERKEKLRCHNKREKKSSNRRFTPHTHPVLHTYTKKQTSSLIIINVINQSINKKKPNSIFFSHRPNFKLECLSISWSR